jgi:hypothetical protein
MAEKKKKNNSMMSKAKSLYRAGRKKFKEMTSPIKSKAPLGTSHRPTKAMMKDVEAKNMSSNSKLRQKMKEVRVAASSTPKKNMYGAA